MGNSTLFLTLRVFSAMGGIEKMSRVAGKALYELASAWPVSSLNIYSMYDAPGDMEEKYFPATVFKGFGKNKMRFMYAAARQGIGSERVVLSHINLLLAGFLVKFFSPKTKLILFAHGIEVWGPVSSWKKYMLGKCDQVLAVSNFTKAKLLEVHGLDEKKITVFNNCLDPFLQPPLLENKSAALLSRYGISPGSPVLITITRLSSKEMYKGYDHVFFIIKELKHLYPGIKYLVVGKYDLAEKSRVDKIISDHQLEEDIIFTGFIPDGELAAHYNIADLYIMPSKKEGFGIVFIEAMYYGKPVIAGNMDGSMDALANGKFGLLVNPDDQQEITAAVIKVISNTAAFLPDIKAVKEKFSYEAYKENLRRILETA